ncbi:hypothetical protein [Neorhizobium galegae]|jgi:hypothetical protein|uniref:Uncharacterized protein n=1 Tax=Neorhizobium galegae bv. orientalis str. HAMBI 540 TaxID=1028800 RepID=A0A068T283_NEOGA|nr:hypothetical protein [Neorhizobium galegae]MCQ1855144.1 hypothetical protein [Neorhizobium galegae]CDN52146.1 Hypothetical protein RG540_PA14700 [Neorhizobium galegae bv. orientalis str. HAMBI 540]CDZ55119.1 Hypothetical protein NGAL_HAMBI2427_60160 [Neorhizobium galegae bv. orientalis]
MSALISVLRQAIQRSNDTTVEGRQRIYASARRGIERLLTRADMPAGHGSLPTQLHRLEDAIKEIEREFSADDRDHTSLELEGNLPDLSTERRQRRSRAKNST